jgi:hypothetical protein
MDNHLDDIRPCRANLAAHDGGIGISGWKSETWDQGIAPRAGQVVAAGIVVGAQQHATRVAQFNRWIQRAPVVWQDSYASDGNGHFRAGTGRQCVQYLSLASPLRAAEVTIRHPAPGMPNSSCGRASG